MMVSHWQSQFDAWFAQQPPLADGAHDLAHVQRVRRTAQHIMIDEPADALIVLAACYFHDIVSLPKDSSQRHLASQLAAARAIAILRDAFPDFPADAYDAVAHAIHAHSFSANVRPVSAEAKIVQDADRLEALGAIGLARVFYVSGALGRSLFDAGDLLAERRPLDDTRYAVDHFRQKLLRLPKSMQTATGQRLAEHNARFLLDYLAKLSAELNGDYLALDNTVYTRATR